MFMGEKPLYLIISFAGAPTAGLLCAYNKRRFPLNAGTVLQLTLSNHAIVCYFLILKLKVSSPA